MSSNLQLDGRRVELVELEYGEVGFQIVEIGSALQINVALEEWQIIWIVPEEWCDLKETGANKINKQAFASLTTPSLLPEIQQIYLYR